jgi:hypothetical protein
VVLTVFTVFVLLAILPARARVGPSWMPHVVGAVALVPMLGVALTDGARRWLRVERVVTLLFCPIVGITTVATLGGVIHAMVRKDPAFGGLQMLNSSIALWVTNVLVFSLLYWQEDASQGVPPGWRPVFVDYLALGFTTATAFSATDALPMTSRAKLLMMLEVAISLVVIAVVAARAINILGS